MFARKTFVLAAVAALTGCGGGGGDASTETSTTASRAAAQSVPEPAQPVAELLPALERFGARGSCAQAVALINRADLPEPTGGPNARNCNSIQGLLALLRAIKVTDSADFGTGAIVDGTVGGKPIAFDAVLDQTRKFKLTGVSMPRHQVNTKPAARADFEAPATAFVKAVRDGNCRAAYAVLAGFSRLAYSSENQFCSLFKANFLAKPAGLGARLRADPRAKLVDLGGSRDTHFFGLATEPAGYRTIVVGVVGKGRLQVNDVVPVER